MMNFAKTMLAGLLLAPLAAAADDMSYTWVDAAYVDLDLDIPGAPSGDGYALKGSVGFAQHWFAFAEYDALSIDVVDVNLMSAGLGGHYGLTDHLDLVGRAGYLQIDVSAPGPDPGSESGYLASLGLRGRLADRVELEGSYMQRDTGNGDEGVWTAGGRFHFTPAFSAGVEYEMGDDNDNLFFAGVRYTF